MQEALEILIKEIRKTIDLSIATEFNKIFRESGKEFTNED